MKTLYACLASALLLGACSESATSSPAKTPKELLTAPKWKLSGHTISPAVDLEGDGVMVSDLYKTGGSCSQDDVTAFSAAGKFSVDEGATKCDADDPQIETGAWALNPAGDSLTLDSDLDDVVFKAKVTELTSAKLVLTQTGVDWDGSGPKHTETLVFSAQ